VEGRRDEWSPETVDITDLHAGQLLTTLTELRSLIHRRLQLSASPPPVSSLQFTHSHLLVQAGCLSRRLYLSLVFRLTPPSQPNSGSQMSVRPSMKNFFDFNEI